VWHAIVAIGGIVAGLGAVAKGYWWGLLVLAAGLWFGREAYLCYRAGNIGYAARLRAAGALA
jgi:hypothetical protein